MNYFNIKILKFNSFLMAYIQLFCNFNARKNDNRINNDPWELGAGGLLTLSKNILICYERNFAMP